MKQTEVIVDLQVVQEIIAYRLRYAFDEIVHHLGEAGVPAVSIPSWDLARFGTNVYIVGFVEDTYNPNWIETYHPISFVRMSRLPGFEEYFTRQRFQPKPRENTYCHNRFLSTIHKVVSSACSKIMIMVSPAWRYLFQTHRA